MLIKQVNLMLQRHAFLANIELVCKEQRKEPYAILE